MKKKIKILSWLLNYFKPNAYVENISEINIELIKKLGFSYVFCDLDNTLVPHFNKFPTKEAQTFRNKFKELGIKFIIVSNNSYKRVSTFSKMIEADDFIYNAKKPLTIKINRMIKKYNINKREILFIGDQFIFDIFVANILNCKSILTLPLMEFNNKNSTLSFIEKFIYKKLSNNNLLGISNLYEEEQYDYL